MLAPDAALKNLSVLLTAAPADQRTAALAALEAHQPTAGSDAAHLAAAMDWYRAHVWMGPESEAAVQHSIETFLALKGTSVAAHLPAAIVTLFADKDWTPEWDQLWDAVVGPQAETALVITLLPAVMKSKFGLKAEQLLKRVRRWLNGGDASPAVLDALAVLSGHSSLSVRSRAEPVVKSLSPAILPHLHAHLADGTAVSRKARAAVLSAIPHASSIPVLTQRLAVEKSKSVKPALQAALDACTAAAGSPEAALPEVLGKTVALVGRFPDWTTDMYRAHLELLGAVTAKSVSKRVNLVFAGKGSEAKVKKAEDLDIPTHDVEVLLKVLGSALPASGLPVGTGPMQGYLIRLARMVAALRQNKKVKVLHFSHRPPAKASALKAAEEALGRPLDPALVSLYTQCNGLKLYWVPTASFDPAHHPISDDASKYRCDLVEVPGCIDILPIEQVARDWSGAVGADSHTDDETVTHRGRRHPAQSWHRQLHFFDLSSPYRYAALLVSPGKPSEVLLCDDHGASWTDCSPTDVSSYLEAVLVHYGSQAGRAREFHRPGSKNRHTYIVDRAVWYRKSPGITKVIAKCS